MDTKPIQILAISGSLKKYSSNRAVINAMALLVPHNVSITFFESLDLLPHFNPEVPDTNSEVYNFRQKLKAADGVVISTPEYAYGIPGVLKNALDWIVSSGELYQKPVALISVSPMITGGGYALESLKLIMSALGIATNPYCTLSIGNSRSKISGKGEITDSETLLSLQDLANQLVNK